jgi:copper transport protein
MLVLVLLALRRSPLPAAARRRLSAEWVARFSGLAAASVGALLATGLVLGTQHVPDWKGLLLTEYGQALVVKLGIVGVALLFGGYNALAAARRRAERATSWIAAEAAVVAGVIFVAAILVELPPATAPAAYAQTAESGGPLAFAARVGELQVAGELSPARVGTNTYAVRVTDASGAPVQGAKVTLRFQAHASALVGDTGLQESREGVYTGSGAGPSQPGRWQALVSVARPGTTVADFGTVDFEAGADGILRLAGTPRPGRLRALDWLNAHGRGLVSVLVLAAAAGWSWFAARTLPARLRPGWLVGGLLVAVLVWVVAIQWL